MARDNVGGDLTDLKKGEKKNKLLQKSTQIVIQADFPLSFKKIFDSDIL